MAVHTRRRNPDARQESWQVCYSDVRVGSIAMRSAIRPTPTRGAGAAASIRAAIQGECTSGTAATFDQARADFEESWRVFLANRTEANFDEYRKHRAWTAWKYAMWIRDASCPPNSQAAGPHASAVR